jgi:hypothetical protein
MVRGIGLVAAAMMLAPQAAIAQQITFSHAECQQIANDCYGSYAEQGFSSAVECFDWHTTGQGIPCEDAASDDGSHDAYFHDVPTGEGGYTHCGSRFCDGSPG